MFSSVMFQELRQERQAFKLKILSSHIVNTMEKPLTHNFSLQPTLYYMHLEKHYYKSNATL